MASPRLAVSTLAKRGLSPRGAQNYLKPRQSLSPCTPELRQSPRNDYNRTVSRRRALIFNVDTPNRRKIVNGTLPQGERHVLLGCGGFGVVYRASYKGNQVAVKIIQRRDRSDEAVEAEKRAAALNHSSIVRIFGIEQGSVSSLIIMELCGISLEEKLEKTSLTLMERIDTWKAVTCAMQFCHSRNIIHADIKPKNVLIAPGGQPKLADFGSSVVLGENKSTLYLRGTPGYVAPEVIKGCMPSIKSDIYSLGILAWQLLTREAPFAGYHPHTILYLTGKGVRPDHKNIDDECSGKYTILYEGLWCEDVTKRPTSSTIINKLNFLIIDNHSI